MMLDEKETGAMRSCLDRLHSCIKGKRGCSWYIRTSFTVEFLDCLVRQ